MTDVQTALARIKREIAPEIRKALEALEEFLPQEPSLDEEDEEEQSQEGGEGNEEEEESEEEEDDPERRRLALEAELALCRAIVEKNASRTKRDEELAALRGQLAAAEGEVGALKGSLEMALRSLEDFDALRRCIGALEGEVTGKQEQMATLLLELTNKTQREAATAAALQSLQADLAHTRAREAEREAQLAASEADRAAKAAEVEKLCQESAQMERVVRAANRAAGEARDEAARIHAHAAAEVEALRGALATREAELTHVLSEWSRLEERARQAEGEAHARGQELRAVSRQLAVAEEQARRAQEQSAERLADDLRRTLRAGRHRSPSSERESVASSAGPASKSRAPPPPGPAAAAGGEQRVWLRAHFGPQGCSVETRGMQPVSIQFGEGPRAGGAARIKREAGVSGTTSGVLEMHAVVTGGGGPTTPKGGDGEEEKGPPATLAAAAAEAAASGRASAAASGLSTPRRRPWDADELEPLGGPVVY